MGENIRGARPIAVRLVAISAALASLALAQPVNAATGANPQRVARLRGLVDAPQPKLVHRATRPRTRAAPGRAPRQNCADKRWWSRSGPALQLRTRSAIHDASLRFGVPRRLIESVIEHESAGNPRAVSHAGAEGLMQLMPATARELRVACSFDPRENVLGGTRYLREMYDRFGSWRTALAAYNAGPTRAASGRWPAETRRYVARVMRGWRR